MVPKLSDFQRRLYADKSMDIGNIALAVLIFGQFVAGKLNLALTILGSIFFIGSYAFAYFLTKNLKG